MTYHPWGAQYAGFRGFIRFTVRQFSKPHWYPFVGSFVFSAAIVGQMSIESGKKESVTWNRDGVMRSKGVFRAHQKEFQEALAMPLPGSMDE